VFSDHTGRIASGNRDSVRTIPPKSPGVGCSIRASAPRAARAVAPPSARLEHFFTLRPHARPAPSGWCGLTLRSLILQTPSPVIVLLATVWRASSARGHPHSVSLLQPSRPARHLRAFPGAGCCLQAAHPRLQHPLPYRTQHREWDHPPARLDSLGSGDQGRLRRPSPVHGPTPVAASGLFHPDW